MMGRCLNRPSIQWLVTGRPWILAKAASRVPDARSATVIFGETVQPVTYPGKTPARVREFAAVDRYERFCEAVDALEAAVELTRPDAARLLVIVSDGIYVRKGERSGGRDRITRLTRHGCAVLWLALDEAAVPMDGAHLVTLTAPAEAADVIGRAACVTRPSTKPCAPATNSSAHWTNTGI